MKLSILTIRNYKGIKEITIKLENISLIIGPNNCSKSTVLQALKQFGSVEKKLDSKYYYRHQIVDPISFHATFTDVSEEEAVLHGIRASLHKPSNNFIVRAIYPWGQEVQRAAKVSGDLNHDLENDGWDGKLGGGANASHFLSAFPEVIYIPAVKNASDELKSGSDTMKTLTTLYKEIILSLDEYTEAEAKTQLLQSKINQHDDEKIKFFESEVQTFLNDVTSTKINFKVNVKPLEEFVSTSVSPFFNFNGIETDIDHQGNGVQRTFIVSVLKGYRKYKSKFTTEKDKNSAKRSLIVAIEEPELYLHPQIAKVFKETLYSLADDDLFQVVATSHSPNFIDLSKPNRTLVKLSLNDEKNVCIHQVDSDIFGLPKDEKDKFQALLKFNPYVNEVFFADHVILVEGDTEVVALKLIAEKLLDARILSPDRFHRTSIVNCAGKATMYVVLNILNNFGINYSVIHDFDIAELNNRGERRSATSLKATLTINQKIETLTLLRNNCKCVFQHTFEAEMPGDYEQGSSKSFSAYEYIKEKSLDQLPLRFVDIVKTSYGLILSVPLDHSVQTLLGFHTRPNWAELNDAVNSWEAPMIEDCVIKQWREQEAAATNEISDGSSGVKLRTGRIVE